MLNESPSNTTNKLSKSDLSTDYVERISEALKHNFFADLAAQYDELQPGAEKPKDEIVTLLTAIVRQNNVLLQEREGLRRKGANVSISALLPQLNEPPVSFNKQKPKKK